MKKIYILLIAMMCISNTYAQTADEYFDRGIAKSNLKNYVGAILDYSKAIELNPEDGYGYYNRGNAKSNLKDHRGALEDYNKAIELNIKNTDAMNHVIQSTLC